MRDLGAGRGPVTDALVGVLFEISIVCHVFVFVVWWVAGVSPVLGVVLVVCCFFGSWVWGFFWFLFSCFMRLCGVGGGFWGVLGLGVFCASGLHSCVVWGWGLGVRLGSRVVRGSGAPGSSACCGGGSGCFVFRLAFSCFSSVLVWVFVVLSGSGVWGVLGWVGVCFLRLLLLGPGWCWLFLGCGVGFGLGLVLFGEFDPGSGRTLAACLTHASRTGPPFFLGWVEWRTGEYHVSNLPSSPG